jgi:hydroxymethylbilane synthase
VRDAAQAVNDEASATCLRAERALTAALEATCHTPVGAYASLGTDGLALTAFVGAPDGSAWVRDRLHGDAGAPEALGRAVAERILSAGARELLAAAEQQAPAAGGRAR